MIGNKELPPNLCKEDRLLLCCIRTFLDKRNSSALKKLLENKIDWSYLMIAAENQRVLPLVYLILHNNCCDAIPKNVALQFQNKFKKNSLNNLAMIKELIQLLEAFSSKGVPLISFKGPIMALDLYGDISMRQYDDLDILVHLENVNEASRLLQSRGYKPEYPWDHRLNEMQRAAFIKSAYHHPYKNPDLGIAVGLHWNINPPKYKIPSIDMDGIWNRAETNTVFGKEVLTFSKEDLLLFLCVHGAKHGWERVSRVCDVATLITIGQVDFQEVAEKADDTGGMRLLLLGLFLANELFSVPLPPDLREDIRADPKLPELAAMATSNLFFRKSSIMSSKINSFFSITDEELFYLKATDRPLDRMRIYLRKTICPTVFEYESIALPNSLYPFYFIVRPIRLIYHYITRLAKS